MKNQTKGTDKPKGKKLTVKKRTVKDLTAPPEAQRGARGGRVSGDVMGSMCGMDTSTYSPKDSCKCPNSSGSY